MKVRVILQRPARFRILLLPERFALPPKTACAAILIHTVAYRNLRIAPRVGDYRKSLDRGEPRLMRSKHEPLPKRHCRFGPKTPLGT